MRLAIQAANLNFIRLPATSVDPTILLSFVSGTWLKCFKDLCTDELPGSCHLKKLFTMRKNRLLQFLKCMYKFANLLRMLIYDRQFNGLLPSSYWKANIINNLKRWKKS